MASFAAVTRAEFVLVNVTEWLKYAELKNSLLLTANVGVVVFAHQFFDFQNPNNLLAQCWLVMATILLLISTLVALSSFFARTKTSSFEFWQNQKQESTNPLYFGHLARMTESDFIGHICPKGAPVEHKKWLEYLSSQVIINSKIAQKKYILFNVALSFTIAALISPVGFLLAYWLIIDEKL